MRPCQEPFPHGSLQRPGENKKHRRHTPPTGHGRSAGPRAGVSIDENLYQRKLGGAVPGCRLADTVVENLQAEGVSVKVHLDCPRYPV